MSKDCATLAELGEKQVVRELITRLRPNGVLLDGVGHDAGFADLALSRDEVAVLNTDRSGENLAYKLGLAGPEAVGDLAVSHAVSDVAVAGGDPYLLTVCLLLPQETTLGYAKRLMDGVESAADRWGIAIASGDTKKNASIAIVVTVMGKVKRSQRLSRSGAKAGDLLVVTGQLGTMFTAARAYQTGTEIPAFLQTRLKDALVNQHPPIELGLALSRSGVARAGTDISDGLPSAIFDLCKLSRLGASLDVNDVPVAEDVRRFAKSSMKINRESLISANGDWQFLYAIPKENLERAQRIALEFGAILSTIGFFTAGLTIAARGEDRQLRHLNLLENDAFSQVENKNYFEFLASNPPLLGPVL